MRFLFWNTHNNIGINNLLCELIIENDISVVALAEYCANTNELLSILKQNKKDFKVYPAKGCERITLIGLKTINIEPGRQSHYASIQIINDKDILCCVHLNSKIYSGHEDDREITIDHIINDIRSTEIELNTENTIIVGDFNTNPYDNECINARYFHGIPNYSEAKRKSRVVSKERFYMFYNPMWSFLGDSSPPYGTYYYKCSKAKCTYWNIYDQVIIRPSLKKRFVDKNLKIISETQTIQLLDKKGHPNKSISDHLPITFEIQEDY